MNEVEQRALEYFGEGQDIGKRMRYLAARKLQNVADAQLEELAGVTGVDADLLRTLKWHPDAPVVVKGFAPDTFECLAPALSISMMDVLQRPGPLTPEQRAYFRGKMVEERFAAPAKAACGTPLSDDQLLYLYVYLVAQDALAEVLARGASAAV